MDLGIAGRVALVAASSKGLGKAVAAGLAAEGVRIGLCSRDRANVDAAAAEIRQQHNAEVYAAVADVSTAEGCASLLTEVQEHLGAIDILVNNAGGPPRGYFDDFDDAAWLRAVELNLMSAIRLTRGVLPPMRAQKWGRIINLTSISVKQPIDGLLLSNSVRAAVHGWAKSLMDEIGPDNILINSVCTGTIMTDRMVELFEGMHKSTGKPIDQLQQESAAGTAVKRIGTPEEYAPLVVFLASERASYITGTSILVDGGRYRGLL